jgi:uncharacterized membrane protein
MRQHTPTRTPTMTRTVALLVAVFVGGATPWLEAIIVIPGGILAGLHPVPALIAGVTGNLLTVALAAWFGDRMRRWWRARRLERRAHKEDSAASAESEERPGRQARRVERVARRWGLPALAVLGPIGLGTQVSVMVAVGIGVEARRAFWWVAAGTVAWSLVAAVAAVTGMSIAGVGR